MESRLTIEQPRTAKCERFVIIQIIASGKKFAMSELKCIVVTPEKTALDQLANFVVVPLFDGEFGVGPGHSPMIGRLGYGELRIRAANGNRRTAITSTSNT